MHFKDILIDYLNKKFHRSDVYPQIGFKLVNIFTSFDGIMPSPKCRCGKIMFTIGDNFIYTDKKIEANDPQMFDLIDDIILAHTAEYHVGGN